MKKSSEIENLIRAKQIKVTKNRVTVLKKLIDKDGLFSAEELSSLLKINIVTIYRILDLFTEKGLLYKTDFREGRSLYEYQGDNHHHHHIVCSNCGYVEKTEICISKIKISKIEKNSNFVKINSHMLEFFGICNKCKNK